MWGRMTPAEKTLLRSLRDQARERTFYSVTADQAYHDAVLSVHLTGTLSQSTVSRILADWAKDPNSPVRRMRYGRSVVYYSFG